MPNFKDALKAANSGFGKPAEEKSETAPFPVGPATTERHEKPAASGASWLKAVSLEEGLPERPKTGSSSGGIPRIWMPPNSEKRLLFLSAGHPIFPIREHQVKVRGNWRNWTTCLQMIGEPCPLCEVAEEYRTFFAYDAAYFTVIDIDGYKKKDGTQVEMIKSLLCAKSSTLPLLKRRYAQRAEKGETLRGALMEVFRKDDPKSPSVGDAYDFIQMVDLKELTDSEEFDLSVVLAPDPEAAKALAEQVKAERSGMSSKPVSF